MTFVDVTIILEICWYVLQVSFERNFIFKLNLKSEEEQKSFCKQKLFDSKATDHKWFGICFVWESGVGGTVIGHQQGGLVEQGADSSRAS